MLNVSKTTLMRSCDKNMTEKIGIPDAVLMENAANAVAQSIKKHTAGRKNGSRVFILIGPGSNGGDGLALLRRRRGTMRREFCFLSRYRTKKMNNRLRCRAAVPN